MAASIQRGNGQKGKGKVTWDHEMRTAVWLLTTESKLTRSNRTAVFNELFKSRLSDFSLPDGISSRTLDAQYQESRKPKAAANWKTVCYPPARKQTQAERRQLTSRIAAVATSLGYSDTGLDARTITTTNGVATPPSTLSVTRTRPTEVDEASDSEYEQISRPRPKRVKTSVVVSVAVPKMRIRTNVTPPETPTSSRLPRSTRATVLYTRLSGSTIWLTPLEFEEVLEDLIPVPEVAAYPPLPALLFRYWTETDECQSKLMNGEFKAGRYVSSNVAPPPLPGLNSRYFPWSDIASHLNRDKVASPFISTSNFLFWIVRLAAKEQERGAIGGRISIIDTTELEQHNVLYVPPFHKALCRKRVFDKGAHYYYGSHEFMVYNTIPSKAIIRTFAAKEDLFDLAEADSVIHNLIRYNTISKAGDYRQKIRKLLSEDITELTPRVVTAIAKICDETLGLGRDSPIEHISHAIADICLGWALHITHLSPREWQDIAVVFARKLCRRSVPAASMWDFERVKMGFLDGMKRKAAAVGLESPAQIIANELDAAKLHILAWEKAQERRVSNVPLQLAEREQTPTPTPGPSGRRVRRTWQSSGVGGMMMYEAEEEALNESFDEEEDELDETMYD